MFLFTLLEETEMHCFLFQISAEFKRITTIQLQSKFFGELDAHSANLMTAYAKKGGFQGRKIKTILAPISQV